MKNKFVTQGEFDSTIKGLREIEQEKNFSVLKDAIIFSAILCIFLSIVVGGAFIIGLLEEKLQNAIQK